MNLYNITVVFKSGQSLPIKTEAEENPLEIFQSDWKKYHKEGGIAIGKYIFDIDTIFYIKVESDTTIRKVKKSRKVKVKKGAKRIRKKLQNT